MVVWNLKTKTPALKEHGSEFNSCVYNIKWRI